MNHSATILTAIVLTVVMTSPAMAIITTYFNVASGDWEVAGNWTEGLPGGEKDEVQIGSTVGESVAEATLSTVFTPQVSDVWIGADHNCIGRLILNDSGSLTIGTLEIGRHGVGTVSQNDPDTNVTVQTRFVIASQAPTSGRNNIYDLRAGTLTIDNFFDINQGEFNQSGGILVAAHGPMNIAEHSVDAIYNLTGGNATLDNISIYNGGAMNIIAGSVMVTDLEVLVGGHLNVSGGELTFDGGSLANNGSFSWSGGKLKWVGDKSFSAAEADSLSPINNMCTIEVTGTATVASDVTLALAGGLLNTSSLTIDGTVSGNGVIVGPITNNGTMSISGGSPNRSGSLDVGSGIVTVLSEGFARIGSQITLDGGTVDSPNGLRLQANDSLSGHGSVNAAVLAGLASNITASGGTLTIGDASNFSGFYSNGTVNINDSTLTLNDLNDVVFDSGASVALGSAGILHASNGITLDFGGNISGYGTVDTPNNAVTPLINNGNINGNSLAEPITLAGYVKGVGTCDNCNITGTDAPGFSTAAVNRGSVSYNGTLEIEIGGTLPGSGFDQLNHILGAGIADLGGTLNVQLIGGFTPSFGDTFDIITATTVQDTFDLELLPTLAGNLDWIVDYKTNGVSLLISLSGDFDFDGDVDGADFLAWQRGEVSNPPSAEDLAVWQANFGAVASSTAAASTGVPEPATGLMLMLGLAVLLFRRHLEAS